MCCTMCMYSSCDFFKLAENCHTQPNAVHIINKSYDYVTYLLKKKTKLTNSVITKFKFFCKLVLTYFVIF